MEEVALGITMFNIFLISNALKIEISFKMTDIMI